MNSWVLDGFCSTDRYPRSGSVVCFCRSVQKTPSTRRKSRKRFRFKQTEIKKRFSLTDEHQSAARTTERICELEVVSLQGNVSDPYNNGNQRYFIFLWWKKSSAPFFVSYCEIPNKKECNLGMRNENFSWPANEMETGSLFSASSWKCFGQTFQSNCFCWYLAVQTF